MGGGAIGPHCTLIGTLAHCDKGDMLQLLLVKHIDRNLSSEWSVARGAHTRNIPEPSSAA